MDFGSIVGAVVTLFLAGIAGLGWLFKLHGDQRVLRERLNGEIDLRKAMEARLNGFEQRIYSMLTEISNKLDEKVSRSEMSDRR